MNPFQRTELEIAPAQHPITRDSKIICAGSCFTSMLGMQLAKYKFQTLVQPFGTIFNPITLSELFLADQHEIEQHSFLHQGVALNYKLNSNPFSAENIASLNGHIDSASRALNSYLENATHLIITLGTAHVYFLKNTLEPVSNCHQLPATLFEKKMLRVEEVENCLRKLVNGLLKKNQNLKFVLTVSPVRHVKDKLQTNSFSKAILRVAVDKICEQFDQASYFPSYELLMDDLRDYRFYAEDLIHPSSEAEAYIWEKFSTSNFRSVELLQMKKLNQIYAALSHKPRFSYSENWPLFKQDLKQKLEQLGAELDLSEERSLFEKLP